MMKALKWFVYAGSAFFFLVAMLSDFMIIAAILYVAKFSWPLAVIFAIMAHFQNKESFGGWFFAWDMDLARKYFSAVHWHLNGGSEK